MILKYGILHVYCFRFADDVIILTIATNDTEGYQRYLRSAAAYDITVKTLGFGLKWKGGNMNYAGGGQKINLIKNELENMKKEGVKDDKIILFTDRYYSCLLISFMVFRKYMF